MSRSHSPEWGFFTYQMNPCNACPWSRAVEPGALGGSPPEVYVGQIMLPFWLPCHSSANYCGKASNVNNVSQCVGAATFRSNICLTRVDIPEPLSLLPANHDLVFSSLSEFYAHHKRIPVIKAQEILTDDAVAWLSSQALVDRNVRVQLKRRE